MAKSLARRVNDLQRRAHDLVSLDARARLARFRLRIGVEYTEATTLRQKATDVGTLGSLAVSDSRQTRVPARE